MRSFLHKAYKNTSEFLLPPLTESKFKERGVLTPEEFVRAGDFLVKSCPTWSWESGDPSRRWSFLPAGKQYLTTKNVPCEQRASAVEEYMTEAEQRRKPGDEEWVATDHLKESIPTEEREIERESRGQVKEEEAEEEYENLPSTSKKINEYYEIGEDEDLYGAKKDAEDVLDISDLNLDDDDVAAAPAPPEQTDDIRGVADQMRTYTLLISYDKHYQVPRVWLIGYDENGNVLDHEKVMEDVISDYYAHKDRKTVTIEQHPHRESGGAVVSIHPCKHAAVMKKLSSVVSGESGEFQIEHYMVLFLKFISSVIPTIEYDYTMASGVL